MDCLAEESQQEVYMLVGVLIEIATHRNNRYRTIPMMIHLTMVNLCWEPIVHPQSHQIFFQNFDALLFTATASILSNA
jgi:hypothetical protein